MSAASDVHEVARLPGYGKPEVIAPPDDVPVRTPKRRTKFRVDWPSSPLVKAVAALNHARLEVPEGVAVAVDRVNELWAERKAKCRSIRETRTPVADLAVQLAAGELDAQGLHDQAVAREPDPILDTIRRTFDEALDQTCREANEQMWAAADDLFVQLREQAERLLDGGTDEEMWRRTWAALRALQRGFLPQAVVPTVLGAADLYRRPDLVATWQAEALEPGRALEVVAVETWPGCRVLHVKPKAGTPWPDARSVRVAAEHRDEWGASMWRASEVVEHVNRWRTGVDALAAGLG